LQQLQNKKKTSINVPRRSISLIDRFFSATATKIAFWGLAFLFTFFILYRLFFAEGFFLRQSAQTKVIVTKEEVNDVLNGSDYEKLIAGATENKNFRLAVRYLYLRCLQKLAIAGAIHFEPDKTNFQYRSELAGKLYINKFDSLTRNYEYIWYGGFAINDKMYSKIHQEFNQFNNEF
jgi:hypothetical protein